LKDQSGRNHLHAFFTIAAALGLLGIFVGWNYILHGRSLHKNPDQSEFIERERIPDTIGSEVRQLAYHDFESGNAADTASHLVFSGHHGKQSLKMSRKISFSPGLWIRFKDLNPGDASWIRATGYVWFSCPPAEAKCSLVATCNHNGINYKYMAVPIEKELVKPNQWNRISIDYHIPPAPDCDDVVQAYFWYRGSGEMLVDDIDIEFYTYVGKK
jgi:hypothetical protein